MNTEKLYIADSHNKEHLSLLKDFEQKEEIGNIFTNQLEKEGNPDENIIDQQLFLYEKEVTDVCQIQGEKDRKVCALFLAPLKTPPKKRRLLTLAIDYIFNALQMESLHISVKENDKILRQDLENRGFENLGMESGLIIYLKEKEEEKQIGRII